MKVFVYGTLKPGEQNYSAYCEGKAIAVQPAYTYGKLYHLCLGYPAMTVGPEKVQGYVLTFADESNLIELDELETFNPQGLPENNEYQRQMIPIYDLEDQYLGKAWGYLMNLEKIEAFEGIFIPSSCWKGARD
jgi:gamma-glutamylcyclotransferase (GGCT)/AIG2-like uncharacterized protein YtfP